MNNGELTVSAEDLIRIFLFLLYIPTVLISYWKLIPRLSPTAKRTATVFLAAQVLVVVVWLFEIPLRSIIDRRVWHIDREWNFPSILTSTQLALAGCIALVVAWFARTRLAWQRLYLVGIGLVFLYLGLDEFFDWKSSVWKTLGLGVNRQGAYIFMGTLCVVTTMMTAIRSPRRMRIWHLCLLIGLSLIAIGGLVVDELPDICGNLAFLYIDGCLQSYILEETLEFLGIWLVLAAMLGHFSDAALPRVQRFLYVLPALWILFLSQSTAARPITSFIAGTQPAVVEFEPGVHLHGFRIEKRSNELRFHLYMSPKQWHFNGLGYSIHLVDPGSDSITSHNEWLDVWQGDWFFTPGHLLIFRHSIDIKIPPQTPVNRAFWIVLTLWRKKGDEYVFQKILASDHQLLNDTQVILGELALPAAATAVPPTVPLAVFDNGFTLDAGDMPERARPGETLNIRFDWHSSADGQEDMAQFLHLGHEESGAWRVYDQQPLGPRLPTRLWYNGLADSETWQVPLPADLAPGRYAVFTGLYRQSDLERVSASDAGGQPWLNARVPLGSLIIEP